MAKKSDYSKKKLIVFDLDGTLAETKSDITPSMAKALERLLEKKQVAVIGGGRYEQFKIQLISKLKLPGALLSRLYLFPTTATSFYRYEKKWREVYTLALTEKEKEKIRKAFAEVLKEIHYVPPPKVYGKIIEDRKTQMTYSFLGQDVVKQLGDEGVCLKKEWVRKYTPLKIKIARLVQKKLPELEVRAAGYTSIDVTQKGIDKAYGLKQIKKNLDIPIRDMVFIGDAIFPGGNDYAAKKTGVECIQVKGPAEVEKVIKRIIKEK